MVYDLRKAIAISPLKDEDENDSITGSTES